MNALRLLPWLSGALAALPSCAPAPLSAHAPQPSVRWVAPKDAGPRGSAPGAKSRLLATDAGGAKDYVMVLARGDEVLTALADFSRKENVVDAHFVAIGGVRDPEVAWFDMERGEFKAMSLGEQMEVLTLSGDIALGENGKPVPHAHLVLGRQDGQAWGGHLLRATTSPTLEVYIRTFPDALHKRTAAGTNLELIDPSAPP
jgi:uncharacterized protein